MESKVKYLVDALGALKATGSVAVTADDTSSKVSIDLITAGRGDVQGRYGEGSFDVIVHFVAGFAAGSDNVYALKLTTFDSAGANPTTQDVYTAVAADVGTTRVFKLDTASLKLTDADAAQFGLVLDVTGTTPSAQYWAYVVPNKRWG